MLNYVKSSIYIYLMLVSWNCKGWLLNLVLSLYSLLACFNPLILLSSSSLTSSNILPISLRVNLLHALYLSYTHFFGHSTFLVFSVCMCFTISHWWWGFQAGSILETRDSREWTALFHAVHAGQRGSVHTLLRHRANANAWWDITYHSSL